MGESPHTITHSTHLNDIFLHEKCALGVHEVPEDLATVVRAWERLPTAVKAGSVAMVKTVQPP